MRILIILVFFACLAFSCTCPPVEPCPPCEPAESQLTYEQMDSATFQNFILLEESYDQLLYILDSLHRNAMQEVTDYRLQVDSMQQAVRDWSDAEYNRLVNWKDSVRNDLQAWADSIADAHITDTGNMYIYAQPGMSAKAMFDSVTGKPILIFSSDKTIYPN